MSRKRSISTDISTDPKLAAVAEEWGALPLLLYTWAIPHANDFGQIAADSTQFRLLVCPALPVKSSEVACAIQQLCAAGLWRRVTEDGREYLQFPEDAWFRHQSYINAAKRPKAAAKPTPAEEQQETPRNAEEQQETAQKGVSPSPSPSPSPDPKEIPPLPPGGGSGDAETQNEPEKPPKVSPLAARFEQFWAAYPKKVSKGAAEKAWNKIRPDADALALMLAALPWQRGSPKWTKDGGQYIPNPATYLNSQGWLDEPDIDSPSGPAPPPLPFRLIDAAADFANDPIFSQSAAAPRPPAQRNRP